jgi:uncharacterized membrane protein YccF (DUF307 family)
MEPQIDHAVTSGTFTLDGQTFDVDNNVWVILLGWELAVAHLITGALLFITIIGIPFAVANWKMIPIALFPLGRQVVPLDSVSHDPYGVPVR